MDIPQLNLHMGFEAYDFQEEYCSLIDEAKNDGSNTLIVMPTGMGKTVALYYAANNGKTLYVTPIRALSNEKLDEMPQMFPHLKVLRDTGADRETRKDFDYVNQDVIITTNERLLSMLNTVVKDEVLENVEYIVIDEIHLVGDINRGPALEWVIMRLKAYYPHITLIGLTATLPNHGEFGQWLDAKVYYKPPESRPIPLEFYPDEPIPFDMTTMPEKRAYKFGQLLRWTYKFKEQFLVFMSSKRDIEKYAKKFAGLGESATLEELMVKKVAFHHADIDEDMKDKILDDFKIGAIRVIFCSPTLAMGVNLPATNCVIFDISFWNDIGFYHEPLAYDKLTQMFGRAGRKGYSTVGRVIMLGDVDELSLAKHYVENPQDTKSQFGRIMVDKVLNMIVNDMATDVSSIKAVIEKSFWFFQNKNIDELVILDSLALLEKYKLIRTATTDGLSYMATPKGRLVTKMYISVHTVIDALHQIYNTKDIKDFYDFFRIFLGNDEFLGPVPIDPDKDYKFINVSEERFSKSNYLWDSLLVNVYDKDENKHIVIDKSQQLKKILALMYHTEFLPKLKFKPSKASINKFRRTAEGLVSRMKVILADELKYKVKDIRFLDTLAMSLKHGTMNPAKLELYSISGFGEKTIDLLIKSKITTKTQLFNTPFKKLKFYGLRISEKRFYRMKAEYNGLQQTTLDGWF